MSGALVGAVVHLTIALTGCPTPTQVDGYLCQRLAAGAIGTVVGGDGGRARVRFLGREPLWVPAAAVQPGVGEPPREPIGAGTWGDLGRMIGGLAR